MLRQADPARRPLCELNGMQRLHSLECVYTKLIYLFCTGQIILFHQMADVCVVSGTFYKFISIPQMTI